MASVISSGTSPMSGFSQVDDDLESWQFLDTEGGGNAAGSLQELAGSLGFDTSPSIVSQGSWGVVGNTATHQHHHQQHQHQHYQNQHQQQQQQQQQQQNQQHQQQILLQTPSPGPLMDHALSVSPMNRAASFASGSPAAAGVGNGAAGFGFSGSPLDAQQHVSQGQFVIEALQQGQAFGVGTNTAAMFEQSQIEFDFGLNNFAMLPDTGFGLEDAQSQSLVHFNIPSSMQTGVDASPPWTHIPMQQEFSTPVVPDSFDSHSGSSIGHFTPPSGSGSSIDLSPKASPGSLQFKLEGSRPAPSRAMPIPTAERKDRTTSKVRKTQKRKSSTPPFLSASRAAAAAAAGAAHGGGGTQGSAGSTPENPVFLFCNATPDTWAKGGGGFDGPPDASKASQKGRKGALSNDTRANALAVRQKGACFCCHVRKVKCDQQRPCRSCERFCAQVPQAVCWQFDDFTRALFPPFMRAHFARDEMARFVADNVASFTLDGVEQPDVTVVLSSGAGLRSKLSVKAKFFTPRAPTSDVMQHWFHTVGRSGGGGGGGDDRVELEALRSAPLGLDSEGSGVSFRAELKRKVEKYVDDMVQEPGWPQQVTASMARKTDLPRRALQAVQRYAQQSGSGIVRRALGVYTMQYMLSHHLTMTPQCVESLRHVNPVAASGPWMTPRLLNRQVKAVVDDLVLEGVAALFDEFGKLLKRRGRAEWAPCTAAFVVFCLLMESIQASADVFVISEIEIEMRNRRPAVFRRAEALDANRAIESMPFKQFAFQFHQIYQSHVRDGSARPFNPLVDDSHDQDRDLDSAALELVMGLRSMVHLGYGELDWLTLAPMAPAGESHPYPRNVEEDYIGRLMAKFLLSFLDSRFISGD